MGRQVWGRRENAKKDFFFPPPNSYGILTEAPHKVLEIQNHVGLSIFTRDFFQENRSQGSGPACLSAHSRFQHLFQASLLSTDLDHISSISPGNFPSLHRKQTSSDQSHLHFLPLSRALSCMLCPPVWVGVGGLLRGPHPAEAAPAPGSVMPCTPASSLPQPLPSSCLLSWHSQKHRSLLRGKPPSKFPLSHLPKKLELAFLSQPNLLTPPHPASCSGVTIPTGLWSSRSIQSSAHLAWLTPLPSFHAALTQGPGTSSGHLSQ